MPERKTAPPEKTIELPKKEKTLLRFQIQVTLIKGKAVAGGVVMPGNPQGHPSQDMIQVPRAIKAFSRHGMYCIVLDEEQTTVIKIPHDNIFSIVEQKVQVPLSVIEEDREDQKRMKEKMRAQV